ncbi:MAG: hypothetical protein U5J62_05865 [Desulfurivibrio sp.]|nr:hypothetical protein [Desulfurivibrio sp.]
MKVINWINGNTTILILIDIAIAFVLGIFYPDIFAQLGKYAIIAAFIMIYPIMINTDLRSVKESIHSKKFISLSLVFHFVISPLLLFLILTLMVNDPSISAGLLFIAIMPASGMAVVWTTLKEGTTQLAIVVLAVSTILAIVVVPLGAYFIVGNLVEIPIDIFIKSILILLILPVTLGYFTRITIIKLKGKEKFAEAKPYIKTISIVGLLAIVFIAFGKEGQTLLSKPLLVVETVLPMILFYVLGFALMTWVGIKSGFSKQDVVALNYSSLTKNRSMALAIAIVALNPLSVTAIALVGVLAQLPMMIVYGKFVDNILSKHFI